jgi:hypothetical protein
MLLPDEQAKGWSVAVWWMWGKTVGIKAVGVNVGVMPAEKKKATSKSGLTL